MWYVEQCYRSKKWRACLNLSNMERITHYFNTEEEAIEEMNRQNQGVTL